MRTLQRAVLALTMLAAFAPPAFAQRQVAAIEHDGTRYGSAVFERDESDGVVRTRETARIGVRALNAREWRTYEQRSSERADGTPLSLMRRVSSGPSTLQASARIADGAIETSGAKASNRAARHSRHHPICSSTPACSDASPRSRAIRHGRSLTASSISPRRRSSPCGSAAAVSPSRIDWSCCAKPDTATRFRAGACTGRSRNSACCRRAWNSPARSSTAAPARADFPRRTTRSTTTCSPASRSHRRITCRPAYGGRTLRYVFESSDGAAPELPVTSEQSVVTRGTRSSIVTDLCGLRQPKPGTGRSRARALPRRERVGAERSSGASRSLARSAARTARSTRACTSSCASCRTTPVGDCQSLGYASALQAAETRGGDCTEFAVLLAALARVPDSDARRRRPAVFEPLHRSAGCIQSARLGAGLERQALGQLRRRCRRFRFDARRARDRRRLRRRPTPTCCACIRALRHHRRRTNHAYDVGRNNEGHCAASRQEVRSPQDATMHSKRSASVGRAFMHLRFVPAQCAALIAPYVIPIPNGSSIECAGCVNQRGPCGVIEK